MTYKHSRESKKSESLANRATSRSEIWSVKTSLLLLSWYLLLWYYRKGVSKCLPSLWPCVCYHTHGYCSTCLTRLLTYYYRCCTGTVHRGAGGVRVCWVCWPLWFTYTLSQKTGIGHRLLLMSTGVSVVHVDIKYCCFQILYIWRSSPSHLPSSGSSWWWTIVLAPPLAVTITVFNTSFCEKAS